MSPLVILIQLAPFLVALIIFVFALSIFAQVKRHLFTVTVVWTFVLMGIAGVLISSRDFTLSADAAVFSARLPAWWTLLSRALNAVMIFGSMAYILANISLKARTAHFNLLLLSYLLFFITNYVISAVFGIFPTFDYRWLYPVFLFVAFSFRPDVSPDTFLKICTIGIMVTLAVSLIAIAAVPEKALQTDYPEAIFSWFDIRMWGLASHPNAFGAVTGMAVIVLATRPMLGRLRWPSFAIAFFCLIFIQSKTAIAAMLFVLLAVKGLPALWANIAGGFRATASERDTGAAMTSLIGLCLLLSAIGVLTALSLNGVQFLETRALSENSGLSTFTGRTLIWDITFQTWKKNIAFGYGPDLWSVAFRTKAGLMAAGQAHNQFLQTLGQSGIVGAIGLTVYIAALIRVALRFHRDTRGLSTMLTLYLLVQTVSEAPLRVSNTLEIGFLKHFMVFGYLSCLAYRHRAHDVAPEPAGVLARA